MNYLLLYPDGEIRQSKFISRKDTEDARIFAWNKAGFVEAVEFHECYANTGERLPWVGVEWWKEPSWIVRNPPTTHLGEEVVVGAQVGYKRKGPQIAQVWPRGRLELWLAKHNHVMELLRTCTSGLAVIVSFIVLLKVFGVL